MVNEIVSKVIANRLKLLLPMIISVTQSAFTPSRLISNSIFVSFEIFHWMLGQKSANGSMDIKVDMNKAYDRVEWVFFRELCLSWDSNQSGSIWGWASFSRPLFQLLLMESRLVF